MKSLNSWRLDNKTRADKQPYLTQEREREKGIEREEKKEGERG